MSIFLVTGAAGFIGSAIMTGLVARGETVRGLDDLSTGNVQNLAPNREKIEFTVGDVRDAALLALLCEGVDTIFHQAAIASVQQSLDDPLGTWDVNVGGTQKLIQAARNAGVRRIIFASSSAVYGDPACQPVREDQTFCPLSPYANQKLASELLLQQAEQESLLETVCLRYFNVFGPRQSAQSPYSGAIARFFQGATQPGPKAALTIFGDGSNSRDFVFIDDVVAANLAAADAPRSRRLRPRVQHRLQPGLHHSASRRNHRNPHRLHRPHRPRASPYRGSTPLCSRHPACPPGARLGPRDVA